MPDPYSIENDFLSKITKVIEKNISNEQFGVSELASEIAMSRSNLLRKVKKLTNISVSQFISQVRLRKAMEMLKETSLTVSEVSYEVGFNSPSYFIKCFRDYYGYPPGEAGKREMKESASNQTGVSAHPHQLAAIMFTDIQGYTALMQQDEDEALVFRNRHREVFNAVTKKFNGRILQYFGDGTLSTFNSAIDAVKCGIEMQQAFRVEPRIPVRIGIHTGDIIISEDGIIGDGVNVAARIESLATVQSVFISEKVYDEIKNQQGIRAISLGEFELKNVDKPLEVFAISNPGLIVPDGDQISGKIKTEPISDVRKFRKKRLGVWIWSIFIILAAVLAGYLVLFSDIFVVNKRINSFSDQTLPRKSIVVLPFRNDSNDSSNVYIINGLMEAILNNLQKIEDLRVISRTSAEKYRNNPKTITEIARELNVGYLIEGSGQKIGDQILLNIQLIEANSDRHLLSEQYNREAKDIFTLQGEVAKNIADKIQVIITPEEEKRINKTPTSDPVAYDYYLKGLDLLHKGSHEPLEEAIANFKKAIDHDDEFAAAYANLAVAYFFLDFNQEEKKYSDEINYNSDKALLFDPQLTESLMAKALFYYYNGEYISALPHLEKALQYNPNSAWAINMLADFYTKYVPDTKKYLEYALKGILIDIAANDSTSASYLYMHVSNAFIQSGFIIDAEKYINKSLEYNPENLFAKYVKAYILYAKDRNLGQTKELLIELFQSDTTRYDIISRIVEICYFMRDYNSAYNYYNKLMEIKEAWNLNIISEGEYAKIGLILSKNGFEEESEHFLNTYKAYAENDQSIYKHLSLSVYNSYMGNTDKAIKHLQLFSEQENYHYWTLIFVPIDPLVDNIKDLPEFRKIMKDIESKFWNSHQQIKTSLEEKDLI
jgi:class 3 adenylate cyclase/TolB-like protein